MAVHTIFLLLVAPIFFVMVGLSLNLREVDWGSSGLLLLAPFGLKALCRRFPGDAR